MYEVVISRKAENQLKKLPQDLQERIITCLERIRIRPQSRAKKLIGNPNYSLRVGKYRIIFRIDEGKLIILVLEIGHRRNVYKKPKK